MCRGWLDINSATAYRAVSVCGGYSALNVIGARSATRKPSGR